MSPGFGCRYSVVFVMMSSTARAVVSTFCKPQSFRKKKKGKEGITVIKVVTGGGGGDERNMSAINRDLPSHRRRTEQGERWWQRSGKSKIGRVSGGACSMGHLASTLDFGFKNRYSRQWNVFLETGRLKYWFSSCQNKKKYTFFLKCVKPALVGSLCEPAVHNNETNNKKTACEAFSSKNSSKIIGINAQAVVSELCLCAQLSKSRSPRAAR